MKRPSTVSYALGNPISVLLLVGAACYLGYKWWIGTGSVVVASVVALVAISGINANAQLSKYGHWKREWEAMEGRASSGMAFALSGRLVRGLFAIAVWLVFAYLALTQSNDPVGRIAADMFWLATLVAIVGSIIQWIRSRSPSSRRSASKDVPVTLCVGLPSKSPDLPQAYSALPSYCAALLNQSRR